MGARIAGFYAEAESIAGLDGKIQLAMLTRIPSTRALVEPDSPQNVARFESAIQHLRRISSPPSRASLAPPPSFMLEASGLTRTLPHGEELLWGVLASLQDAMVAVYERNGQPLLAWESRSLEKRYPMPLGSEPLGTQISRRVGQILALQIGEVFDGYPPSQHELQCELLNHAPWFSVTLSAVHDETGRTLGVNAFVQDISERKSSEERARQNEARLREHTRVYVDLISQKSSFLTNVHVTMQRVTEASANTLGVSRASVWLYDPSKTRIDCLDLFEAATNCHSAGLTLEAKHYPAYFTALLAERTIAAQHAHTDARTVCFSESYLRPLGIESMLDVPIWVHGDMVGVLCLEHIGSAREWTADEENFAYLLANFVSLAKEVTG
jgi:hypothetical protein